MEEYDLDEVEKHLGSLLMGIALGELKWLISSLRETWSPKPDNGRSMLDGPEARVAELEGVNKGIVGTLEGYAQTVDQYKTRVAELEAENKDLLDRVNNYEWDQDHPELDAKEDDDE